jgi:hypothetical protein
MFIKTDSNNKLVAYPYTLDMFRQEHPNTSLPKFLNNRFLAANNVYPVYASVLPEHDGVSTYLVKNTVPYLLEDNSWAVDWLILDKSAESIQSEFQEYKAEFRKTINHERDVAIYQVVYVDINETTTVPVDVRENTHDIQNIAGVTQTGTVQTMINDTTPIAFRGSDNLTYQLTPQEAILLGKTVGQSVADAYSKSWTYKDALDETTTIAEIDNIMLDF